MAQTPSTPLPSPPATGRWQVFQTAPHRMFFLPGVVQAVLVIALWTAELAARAGALPWAPFALSLPTTWVHGFLMLYGLFPFFIFGFLLTVYPRWMNTPAVPTARYVPAFALLTLGMLGFYLGLGVGRILAAAAALALYLAGEILVVFVLFGVYRMAAQPGAHERLLNLALLLGLFGQGLFLFGIVADKAEAVRWAFVLGLWGFLVPMVFTVSHRMIPFFSSAALPGYTAVRPTWSLRLAAAGLAGHAVFELLEWRQYLFVFDLPLALLGLHHSWLWSLKRSLEVRLLAMLHLAFLWFGLGMGLAAFQSLALFASGQEWLARAPLHALGIGFVGGMMVAMVSRVTLGHSGRPLVADALTWLCFLGIEAAAVVRVAAELAGSAMNLAAAVLWLASLLPWAARYAPMYLRPRVDGKPG